MNAPTCARKDAMLKRLLTQDSPLSPSLEDLEHTRVCPVCRDAIREIKALEADFTEIGAVITQNSPKFIPKGELKKILEREIEPRDFWKWIPLHMLLPAFAVVLISLSLMYLTTPWDSPSSKPIQSVSNEDSNPRILKADVNSIKIVSGQVFIGDNTKIHAGQEPSILSGPISCLTEAEIMVSPVVSIKLSGAKISFRPGGIDLIEGSINVHVMKKGTIFSASTPSTMVQVTGTRFRVKLTKNSSTMVNVDEGNVRVSTISGENHVLAANQSLLVDKDGYISQSSGINQKSFRDKSSMATSASDISSTDGVDTRNTPGWRAFSGMIAPQAVYLPEKLLNE